MKTQLLGPIALLGFAVLQLTIGVLASLGIAMLQRWFLADILLTIVFCSTVGSINKRLRPLNSDSKFAIRFGTLAVRSCSAFIIAAVVVTGVTYIAHGNARQTQVAFVYCASAFSVAFFGMLLYEKAFDILVKQSGLDE